MDFNTLTKYAGQVVVLLVVVFAVLFVGWFIELPLLSPVSRTVFGYLGF